MSKRLGIGYWSGKEWGFGVLNDKGRIENVINVGYGTADEALDALLKHEEKQAEIEDIADDQGRGRLT
ncbi:unnamed protein product [marine sediment metagenome]|uniref:Uncharacterized protein n=1 Tax=marine sediment metagenome TaxID=412755 RepID=X1H0M0_9ZZZZ